MSKQSFGIRRKRFSQVVRIPPSRRRGTRPPPSSAICGMSGFSDDALRAAIAREEIADKYDGVLLSSAWEVDEAELRGMRRAVFRLRKQLLGQNRDALQRFQERSDSDGGLVGRGASRRRRRVDSRSGRPHRSANPLRENVGGGRGDCRMDDRHKRRDRSASAGVPNSRPARRGRRRVRLRVDGRHSPMGAPPAPLAAEVSRPARRNPKTTASRRKPSSVSSGSPKRATSPKSSGRCRKRAPPCRSIARASPPFTPRWIWTFARGSERTKESPRCRSPNSAPCLTNGRIGCRS